MWCVVVGFMLTLIHTSEDVVEGINTAVIDIAVVGSGVESGTWAALIARTEIRRDESMLASD